MSNNILQSPDFGHISFDDVNDSSVSYVGLARLQLFAKLSRIKRKIPHLIQYKFTNCLNNCIYIKYYYNNKRKDFSMHSINFLAYRIRSIIAARIMIKAIKRIKTFVCSRIQLAVSIRLYLADAIIHINL